MGKLMFGVDEKITCLEPVKLKGANDEALCIAFKQHTRFFGAGVYVGTDGYVLGVQSDSKRFYDMPDATELKAMQADGLLPDPLPPYSLNAFDYLFGYSLWLIIGGMVAWSGVKRWLTKARQARDALVPVTYGPPTITTEADTFVRDSLAKLLQPNEVVQHQAYALPVEGATTCLYVGLTNQRLLLLPGKVGAFKPVLEHGTPQAVSRDELVDAKESSFTITFKTRAGGELEFFVPTSRHFSNQATFVRDVPRMFTQERRGEAAVQVV